jgi:hypothetical protein
VVLRRRETELSLERPLGPEGPLGGVVRLSVRLEPASEGELPSPRELAEALDGLKADLNALVGPPLAALPASRTDRDVAELIGTYRPRQRELVDLLRDDGEITPTEHTRLVEYLTSAPTGPRLAPSAPPPDVPKFDQPIAAVPIAAGVIPTVAIPADRVPESSRPVPELLQQFQITSLKQAGAVRARRQISFEEYMLLKRHFQQVDPANPPTLG